MTTEKAIDVLEDYGRYESFGDKNYSDAFAVAVEALTKMKAIQRIIDMPFEWEQDDRRRYAKIVDIVRQVFTDEVE